MSETCLQNLDADELARTVAPWGVPASVARKLFARIHRGGEPGLDGVPGLSKRAAAALATSVRPDLPVVERREAADGFVKYLFRTSDGHAIEAVRIPLPDPQDARALRQRRRQGGAAPLEALPTAKYTICVSSQVGCALACAFCATGKLGGIRSLETWEILSQVRRIAAEASRPVRGVVFMGMGEPFANYDNVIRAARILSHPAGHAIAARAISISTAGIVPAIHRYTAEGHRFRLIISLGAPTSSERQSLMPIENRWPLRNLVEAARAHVRASGQRISLAYVAIGGPAGNVSARHAAELEVLLAGLPAKLNLIDVTDETGVFPRPSEDEIRVFRDALAPLGIPIVRRYSGGAEIGAACGTLSASSRGGRTIERPD